MSSAEPTLTPPSAPPPAPPLTPPGRPVDGKGQGGRKALWVAISGVIVLILLAAGVVLWLPDMAQQGPHSPDSAENAVTSAEDINTPGVPPQDAESSQAEQAAFMQQATEAQQLWLEKKAGAELENMGVWGGEEYARAIKLSEQALVRFREKNFKDSIRLFQQAASLIDTIEASRHQILEKAMTKGMLALDQGSQKQAEQAFGKALAIDPSNIDAQAGLKRAAVTVQVHSMLEQARKLMEAGEYKKALTVLEKTVELDPACASAGKLLDQAKKQIIQQKFDIAMGRAISALAAGRYVQAEDALKQAGALSPSDPAVSELSRRLREARSASKLHTLLGQAQKAVDREEWDQAIKFYTKALATDPLSVEAKEGLARSEKRLALHKALEKIIASPWNLNEKGTFRDARNTVRMAEAVNNPGPVLKKLTAAAQAVLRQSQQKISVTFVSDNMTDVLIYHLGRLGKFTSRTLRLRPGIYTLKGMREGYRDILMNIRIRPGDTDIKVDVRCREKI